MLPESVPHSHLICATLSYERRGFCPSCVGRRIWDFAARFVDSIGPRVPIKQWVLPVPHGLRFRMAFGPTMTSLVLLIFVRAVAATMLKASVQRCETMPSGIDTRPTHQSLGALWRRVATAFPFASARLALEAGNIASEPGADERDIVALHDVVRGQRERDRCSVCCTTRLSGHPAFGADAAFSAGAAS